jgi:fimbrial chaperone protein
MHRVSALAAFTLLASSVMGEAEAQSLRVSPVTIDLSPGAASAVYTLDTEKPEGVSVQVRVFRWSQANGEDKLEKTEDVVVSPPVLTVHQGASSTIRLVRVAKAPVSGEEAYRVMIDEIPDRKNIQAGAVMLRIRQSLPVFFNGVDARPGAIAWKVVQRDSKFVLEATNPGRKRSKVSKLTVTDDKNRDVVKIDGVAGYVLGGQSKAWDLAPSPSGPSKTLSITAESDTGQINATVNVGKAG